MKEKETPEKLPEKLYSLRELSKLLGVSISTLRNQIRAGRLRAIQLPGVFKFSVPASALHEYLDAAKDVPPGSVAQKVANLPGL